MANIKQVMIKPPLNSFYDINQNYNIEQNNKPEASQK